MLAVRELHDFDWARCLTPDRLELRHGSVLVIDTLDRQHGACDTRQAFLDIPTAKILMQPDIIPTPKRFFRVFVVTLHSHG